MPSALATDARSRTYRALERRERLLPIVAFAGVLVAALLYVSYTGLIVHMGDSFLLANRAKHLADEFNLNLNNGLAPLIYPPLYPLFIAFAYRFQDPHTIFRSILFLNCLLTASQVFPLRLILVEYANVTQKNALWLATALALSPVTFPYTNMMMTDVLYCPVVVWLALLVSRAMDRGRAKDFLGSGIMLALAMMTRSAATVLLVAYGIALVAYAWRAPSRIKKGAMAGFGLAAAYGPWLLFERFFVKYEGFLPQFRLSNVIGIFFNAQRFDLHASWFSNLLFYYLTAPLCLAGVFVCVLFIRRPSLLRRDVAAVFFVSTMLVGAAVAAFVTEDFWGGRDLTWNRYTMPYVIFVFILAIKYRKYFNRYFLFLCSVLLALTALSFRPSYLGYHSADALALFGWAKSLKLSDALMDLLCFAFTITPAWLWLRNSTLARRLAVIVTGFAWLGTHAAAAYYYRNSGDLNITEYKGLAQAAYQESHDHPGSQVYYDPEFTKEDSFSGLRVLFYWPNLDIHALKRYQFAQLEPPGNMHVLYFTTASFASIAPVGVERGNVKLYDLTGEQLRTWHTQSEGTPLWIDITGKLPNVEIGERDHQRYAVRWLGQNTEFQGTLETGSVPDAVVVLELATNGPPRTAKLIVNGNAAEETYQVDGNFWSTSSTVARFHVPLKQGVNSFRLLSVQPAGKLSDGREAAFLMIGDVKILRASRRN